MEAGGGGRQRWIWDQMKRPCPLSGLERWNLCSVTGAAPGTRWPWDAAQPGTRSLRPLVGVHCLGTRRGPWSSPTCSSLGCGTITCSEKGAARCVFVRLCRCVCAVCVCLRIPSLLCPLLHEVKLMPPAQLQCTESKCIEPSGLSFLICVSRRLELMAAKVPSKCNCRVLRPCDSRVGSWGGRRKSSKSLGRCFL